MILVLVYMAVGAISAIMWVGECYTAAEQVREAHRDPHMVIGLFMRGSRRILILAAAWEMTYFMVCTAAAGIGFVVAIWSLTTDGFLAFLMPFYVATVIGVMNSEYHPHIKLGGLSIQHADTFFMSIGCTVFSVWWYYVTINMV
ncbi:hypothetical protein HGA91_06295 [candidate division WWE3 bacterium]|nr:hypothetical protein [candidate division WWE3 bacterium]